MTVLETILNTDGFFLGGSRRMNEMYPDKIIIDPDKTDYDFYIDYNPTLADFCYNLGFRRKNIPIQYTDNLCVSVLSYDNIQVCIRVKVDVYHRVFESLTPEEFMTKVWKSSPLRDPDVDVTTFRAQVREYLNRKFAAVINETRDEIPF